MTKAQRLRDLAIKAYHVAETPKEAKMAGILLDLFAPDVSDARSYWVMVPCESLALSAANG